LEAVEQFDHLHGVGEVSIMQEKPHSIDMRVAVKVIDAACIEGGGAANDAMDLVPLLEEKLGEIGSVLTCDTGDEGAFHG
jgi:hypothetical protein